MTAILISILSGILAGEVLYKFIDEENLLSIVGLSFILILSLGLMHILFNDNVIFVIMSLITGISMVIHSLIRTYFK